MPLRLKSLELHGYKTFANRTMFEFSEAVTAIVGPNGSGKSNIADSLRWVLGEQSFSLLRAKKTEDMIFSGSESRPRAGMASATITFSNEDGWLPIDFSEVAITRRAYRDGENEYLINGQRVRLRDVTELLSQSGLAERTYTVIGQGLVDAALSLKAEERRKLFEEAAGIGLHRSRREDALRRLEITRRNLERAQDILAELRPRLQSLERQARRAKEYDQVKVDLRVMLREWYGFHWHDAQRGLAEARQAAHAQELKLEKARQEQHILDERRASMRARIQELRAGLSTWHRQLSHLHTQRETLSREIAVAEERSRSLSEQQKNTQTELGNLEQEIGLAEARSSEAKQESERFEMELQEARDQALAAQQSLELRQAERAKAEHALHETRQKMTALNARQGQLQALLSERRAQAERAQRSLEAVDEAYARVESELRSAAVRLEEMQSSEQEAQRARGAAEESLHAHHRRMEMVEQERRQAAERHAAVMAEQARLKAQLDVLEQAEASFVGYSSGARLLQQAAQQGRLRGVSGALSKYLKAPADLEIAITAALGDFVDAVLLETDLEEALALLEGEAGRGVLLPLDNLKPASLEYWKSQAGREHLKKEDVIGIAAELVKVPGEFRSAVELLLGDVLVVRDRRTAMRLLPEQLPGVRLVTLRGEVFHASGPVQVIGAGEGASEQTVLSRVRQVWESNQRLQVVENEATEIEAQIRQIEAVRQHLQAEETQLELENLAAQQAWDKVTAAKRQAENSVGQAKQQVNWQSELKERHREEISQSQADALRLSTELAQQEDQLSAGRGQLRQQNTELETLSLDEYQSQFSHWNTMAAVAERALADARTHQHERQTILEKQNHAQAEYLERSRVMGASLETLSKKTTAQRQLEREIGERIAEVQEQINPSETDLQSLEQEQVDLQKLEVEARQGLSMAEHFYAQTRITFDRRQESLNALRRRIEEDFGLVAFEYAEQISGPTPLPLEGMVEQLPAVKKLSPEVEELIKRQRAQLRRMGAINPEAQAEYQEVQQRYTFLTEQMADLQKAEEDVRQVISELDVLMEREFHKTFQAVAAEFREIFTRLFGGGSARLVLSGVDNVGKGGQKTSEQGLTMTGIEIEARLPGRREQGLALLSGGERSLTATALVFSLLKVSPTPFCVLDEVDAMLDEANVGRFRELLSELSQGTQFVIVTHNRNTVLAADVLYGVTMGRDSVSQVLSLKLDEVAQLVDS